ncbi:hypothetical protein OAM41_06405 [Gammaproteobacteria bacterium]|nr:hypothetical protein [Gammaproteobacteria bacterium]
MEFWLLFIIGGCLIASKSMYESGANHSVELHERIEFIGKQYGKEFKTAINQWSPSGKDVLRNVIQCDAWQSLPNEKKDWLIEYCLNLNDFALRAEKNKNFGDKLNMAGFGIIFLAFLLYTDIFL